MHDTKDARAAIGVTAAELDWGVGVLRTQGLKAKPAPHLPGTRWCR